MQLSLKKDVKSFSYFKTHFARIIRKNRIRRRPVVITQNGKSAGVFMDIDTWENHIRKLTLMRLVNEGELSIATGKSFSPEEVDIHIAKKYGA